MAKKKIFIGGGAGYIGTRFCDTFFDDPSNLNPQVLPRPSELKEALYNQLDPKYHTVLFDQKETFHFTIKSLNKMIKKNFNENISLATLYNTVHAFKKKGYNIVKFKYLIVSSI